MGREKKREFCWAEMKSKLGASPNRTYLAKIELMMKLSGLRKKKNCSSKVQIYEIQNKCPLECPGIIESG